jgi:hypothetical protein
LIFYIKKIEAMISTLGSLILIGGDFIPQETFGSVWRYFDITIGGKGAISILWIDSGHAV